MYVRISKYLTVFSIVFVYLLINSFNWSGFQKKCILPNRIISSFVQNTLYNDRCYYLNNRFDPSIDEREINKNNTNIVMDNLIFIFYFNLS
jgi:hypothetical protein